MRCGVRAGAVDSFAGRPGQGTGGTGGVEEEVHEEIRNREQGTRNRDQGSGNRDQGTGIRTWLRGAAARFAGHLNHMAWGGRRSHSSRSSRDEWGTVPDTR